MGLGQFGSGDTKPVLGLFWLHVDSIFDSLGVTVEGAIRMFNWVMELSSNVDVSQSHPQQLCSIYAKNSPIQSPSTFDHQC